MIRLYLDYKLAMPMNIETISSISQMISTATIVGGTILGSFNCTN